MQPYRISPRGRIHPRQTDFFGSAAPEGLLHCADFISVAEETDLLLVIRELPLKEAQYKEWRAKRRIVSFGGHYDFSQHELLPEAPIPPFLFPLRERAAAWTGIPAGMFQHALIAEYRPGTQLGPEFEAVVGVSLGGTARMRFRPHPPEKSARAAFALQLEPRSAYVLRGSARWRWQHAISPTKELRFSVTFRTLCARRPSPFVDR